MRLQGGGLGEEIGGIMVCFTSAAIAVQLIPSKQEIFKEIELCFAATYQLI